MIDLTGIPIVDHHAHSLLKTDQPLSMERYQGFFSESADPVVKSRDVPHSIMWQWGIRELAGYLGCEPTPEAVLAARSAIPLTELVVHDLTKARLSLPREIPSYPVIHGEGWPRKAILGIMAGADEAGHDGVIFQGTGELVTSGPGTRWRMTLAKFLKAMSRRT